eukprot:NODE_10025_length_248_cov_17.829146_g9284_i0.p1 GENE.NODE_10025_length_248_cov_17.829146_g9284_i0~~NODE_10025_length_248_cov_17.829146_g9284_i0.p1  ORF type:complete len:82 (-),score=41.37 NODE_10025_length_248_cov_17.829146_g9284_i0:3-212(-)
MNEAKPVCAPTFIAASKARNVHTKESPTRRHHAHQHHSRDGVGGSSTFSTFNQGIVYDENCNRFPCTLR